MTTNEQRSARHVAVLFLAIAGTSLLHGQDSPKREALRQKLEPHYQPPAEFAGLGEYRSPLKFEDGSEVKSPDDWPRRRKEIAALWQKRLGAWPPLVEQPEVKRLETTEREGFTQHHVH